MHAGAMREAASTDVTVKCRLGEGLHSQLLPMLYMFLGVPDAAA